MIGFQRRPPRWLSLPIGLTLALIGTFGMVNSAQADDDDTSWYKDGHVYDEWSYWPPDDIDGTASPGQYKSCESPDTFKSHGVNPALFSIRENIIGANIASGLISVAAAANFSIAGSGTWVFTPGDCITFSPVTLTNNTVMPVEVSFIGFGDNGTIAPYLFEWMGDQSGDDAWPGTTVLQPGESTEPFAITLGMPKDVPNAGKDTSGDWWATFKVVSSILQCTVWSDLNDDGMLDDGEPLLEGFKITGQSSTGDGTVIASGTTDSNGVYSFFYEGGTVTITIADPTKWQPKWLIMTMNGETIQDTFSVSEDGTEYSYELPTLEPGSITTLDIGLKPGTKQPPDDNGGGDNGGSTEPPAEPGDGDNGGSTEPGGGDNGEDTEPPAEPSDNGDNGGSAEPPTEPSGGNGGITEPSTEPGGTIDGGTTNPATTNATNPANHTDNTPSIDAGTGGQVVNPSSWAVCIALAVSLATGCVILATRRKVLN